MATPVELLKQSIISDNKAAFDAMLEYFKFTPKEYYYALSVASDNDKPAYIDRLIAGKGLLDLEPGQNLLNWVTKNVSPAKLGCLTGKWNPHIAENQSSADNQQNLHPDCVAPVLKLACKTGNLKILSRYCDMDISLAIKLACKYEWYEGVSYLVEKGAEFKLV